MEPTERHDRTLRGPNASWLSPADVAAECGIPETTQAVWRCTNRYGFRKLVVKVGNRVRYRREEVERWLESHRLEPAE